MTQPDPATPEETTRCGGSGQIVWHRDDPRGPEFNMAPDSTAAGGRAVVSDETRFHAEDFEHGLRCMDCGREFVEGQRIAEVPYAMDEWEGEPMVCSDLKCVECAAGATYAD